VLHRGVGYVPQDRHARGFAPQLGVGENLTMAVLDRVAPGALGLVSSRVRDRIAQGQVAKLQIVASSLEQPVSSLSGGNQQKVVVAKWLETDPDFIVLDEPTKGIDVGARANIYAIIHALAARGKGVLVVSSEAEELLSLCHRILVMRNGETVGEFDPEHADTDDLIRTALSHRD